LPKRAARTNPPAVSDQNVDWAIELKQNFDDVEG
jgi:hypothetical protein